MYILQSSILLSLLWQFEVADAFAPSYRRPIVGSPTSTSSFITGLRDFRSGATKLMATVAPDAQTDLYYLLEVPRNAGEAEIRQAFRKMAKKYHPGMLSNQSCQSIKIRFSLIPSPLPHIYVCLHFPATDSNPNFNTVEIFQQINRAYEVLRNPDLRRNYDMYGFDGIGTSAASDAEEMAYHNQNSNEYHNQHNQYANYQAENDQASSESSFFGCDQNQPRERFQGGCFVDVDVENLGMGATCASEFFGKSNNGAQATNAHSTSNVAEERQQATWSSGAAQKLYENAGGAYVGETSHSFFQDVDPQTGKPRGARAQKKTNRQAAASQVGVKSCDDFFKKSRSTFYNGRVEVKENSYINNGQAIPSDQTKSKFPSSKNQEAFFNGRFSNTNVQDASKYKPNKNIQQDVSKFKPKIETPFAGARPSAGRVESIRSPGTGGDIEVTLEVDSVTAAYGGAKKVSVTRLGHCDACFGSGCAKCGGMGLKRGSELISVPIPAGSQDGIMIRLAGEGHAGSNGNPAGDILVTLRTSDKGNSCRPETPRSQQQGARRVEMPHTRQVEIPTDLSPEEQALLNQLQARLNKRRP